MTLAFVSGSELNSQFLDLLIKLIILFAASILFSAIAKSFKQPVVLGYILGGMLLGLLLGPATPFTALKDLLGGFSIDAGSGILYSFSQIGVIMLLFQAGIDTNFDELKANGSKSFLTAILGVATPFLLVFSTFMLIDGNLKASIAMGAVATATSISISLQTLKNLGQLKSKVGIVTTGAAIIDDIIGIIMITLLGLFFGENASGTSLWEVLLKMGLIFGAIALIGVIIVAADKKIRSRNWRKLHTNEIMMAVLAFLLLLSFEAQQQGVSAILGAYFAGLILSMTRLKATIEHNIQPIAEIFFAPIFFMSIGLSLEIAGLGSVLLAGLLISLLAILGKGFGSGAGARISGLDLESSKKIGIAMVPMGEVAFIIASLAQGMGVLNQSHLAMAVIVIIVTSVVAPLLLKRAYERN